VMIDAWYLFFYVSNPPDYTYIIYNPIYNNIDQYIIIIYIIIYNTIYQDHWIGSKKYIIIIYIIIYNTIYQDHWIGSKKLSPQFFTRVGFPNMSVI
jgi:hypothetical protein